MGNKVGRPKSELDLKDDWKEQILNLYSMGKSDVSVKAWIWRQRGSFSNDLWERWMKEEPGFSETVKMGRILAQDYLEGIGLESVEGIREMNTTAWIFTMKNRFREDWRDKIEQDVNNTGVQQDRNYVLIPPTSSSVEEWMAQVKIHEEKTKSDIDKIMQDDD